MFNNFRPGGRMPGPSFNNYSPMSNKLIVGSLEEALSMYTDFNSNMVYWDKNENLLYDVYTDGRGAKTYDVFEVTLRNKPDHENSVANFDKRLKMLEDRMEEIYGKRNVEQNAANAANAASEL